MRITYIFYIYVYNSWIPRRWWYLLLIRPLLYLHCSIIISEISPNCPNVNMVEFRMPILKLLCNLYSLKFSFNVILSSIILLSYVSGRRISKVDVDFGCFYQKTSSSLLTVSDNLYFSVINIWIKVIYHPNSSLQHRIIYAWLKVSPEYVYSTCVLIEE